MSRFTDLLADRSAVRRWLMIAEPWNPALGATIPFYWSDSGFRSAPGDTPASTHWPARIASGPVFERSLVAGTRLRGTPAPDFGFVRLLAGDRGDGRTLDSLADYGWRGRRVRLLLGGDGFALAEFGTVFDGVADGIDVTTAEIAVRLRDRRHVLDRALQTATFAGTGDYEGGDDVAGRSKPRVFGTVRNVQPVYVGMVGGRHTFCVSSSTVADVTAVRQNGGAITKVAGVPGAGEYRLVQNSAGAFVELGGAAVTGVVTADVATSETRVAKVAESIALAAGLVASDLDAPSFDALHATTASPVGLWLDGAGASPTANALLADVLAAVGAVHWFDRAGRLRVRRLASPGAAIATFDRRSLLEPGPRPQASSPRVWRVRLGAARAWRVQTLAELAGGATDAARSFASEPYRWSLAEDATIRTADLDAEALEIESLLDSTADADAEAARLLALHGPERRVIRVAVAAPAFAVDLGDAVAISDSRLGLAAGWTGLVVAMREDAAAGRHELALWG